MYEGKTFEYLLSSMLDSISEQNPDLDVQVGSVIYTALAPIALELETAYREMDMLLEETFIETASKDYLIKHGSQMGIPLNDATYAHFKGEFDVDVPIGSRFSFDKFNYFVMEQLSTPTEDNEYYIFELVCETVGSEPNNYLGDLTPITYVENLSHAKLISVSTFGEDEEDTESYRYRLQTHYMNAPIDGNVSQYEEWLGSYDGIGKYKVLPRWNGANTVKLMVLNPENEAADTELIKELQEYFDPVTVLDENKKPILITEDIDAPTDPNYPQGRGMGDGQAPIGAVITVSTVKHILVKVECQLKLKEDYSTAVGVEDAVKDYLKSTALVKSTIDYMAISAEIYKSESVDSVLDLKITANGVEMSTTAEHFTPYVNINSDEIAVLDTENSVWGV